MLENSRMTQTDQEIAGSERFFRSLLGFSNRFSSNRGGGVKYFFNRRWGVRAEARWSPSHTTQGQTVYRDRFFGRAPTTVANKAEQGQANIGLIFPFK